MSKTLQNSRSLLNNSLGRYTAYFDGLCDRFFSRAWPSYTFVAVLQLKVIWGIWRRDLTIGDTSYYFAMATRWSTSLHDSFVWSPLYTAYYGTIIKLTGDVYVATILHRVIIVLAATIGCLAIMRRLLPASLALLIACWWAVLPINFDTLYEIHLFAVLPVLAAWIIAASADTAKTRGAALAILLAAAVLVRNELIVASFVYGLICLGKELADLKRARKTGGARINIVVSYAVPLAVAGALCLFFYWRSDYKYPEMLGWANSKHTLNMCQVYAFGYAQRHPDWTLSPWAQCQGLMQATFGRQLPSLTQMITANPRAVLDHFLWNLSLTPSGLQVALFNSMTGTVNPDYVPVHRSWLVLPFSVVSLIVVAAAGILLARNWHFWWSSWFRPRSGAWLILLSVVSITIPIILTQRPRPSYLFATTLVLMAVIGSSVYVLMHKWPTLLKRIAFVTATAVLVFIPSYYLSYPSERPIYEAYRALQPFKSLLKGNGNKIVLGDYTSSLTNYLTLPLYDPDQIKALGSSYRPIITYDYTTLSTWNRAQPLNKFLDEKGINFFFIEPRMIAELQNEPSARDLLEHPETVGWRRLHAADNKDAMRFLLHRRDAEQSQ